MRAFFIMLLSATSLFAQTHDPFPIDFTVAPCAPSNTCQSFPRDNMPSASVSFYGRQLDGNWVHAHADAVIAAMGPACLRQASCLATPGNTFSFCDDVLLAEVQPVCDRLFPQTTDRSDWDQCSAFRDIYLLGVEQHIQPIWKQLQPCVMKNAVAHTKPLDVWTEPATLPAGFNGDLEFFALDADTHMPILARITFEGQTVYAPANPSGNPVTFYPFKYALKYVRVPNSDSHTDLVPPMITVSTPAYPDVSDAPPYPVTKFRLPAAVAKLIVTMAPEKLRKGENHVTISAHDAATGIPVEMRVIVGTDQIGNTNSPLVIDLRSSTHHPEIWLTSLYDRYSDVVVAKAN